MKWFDYQVIWHYHLIISDSAMCNVYKTFTHKSNKPDSSHWLTPYDNHLLCTLSPTNLLPTVGYFRFLYVPSSSVKTPLSSQVGNLVFILAFYVLCSVLSIVLFLRASCCFPSAVKTRSIPPPDPGQPWNCLHILTTSGYVRFTWACPGTFPFQ